MTTLLAPPRTIAAAACRAPWGPAAAGLPGAAPAELPGVPGFVLSRFNPLIADVVVGCLGEPGSDGDLTAGAGASTAVVLATTYGDTTTSDVATQRLVAGQVHSPLLFFQSVTTSILGHLTKRYGVTGPLSCLSTGSEPALAALEFADVLLDDEDMSQVLVVGVETAANERVDWVREHVGTETLFGPLPHGDAAVALLLRADRPHEAVGARLSTDRWPPYGWLSPLAELAAPHM
ncbi:beta-ketoacyl synthase chain length factor [Streptomyces sp. CBMA152]|uniref:beta-ketoacyl synthase chain length factor n=1 Tax=Streptomyces sp. CBMA152 TaxID=1896312 RepID=UPI0016617E69|nr:beta-ketoacyl synthase chain length factor [Streptomyces sp. CBMA152]MBD0743123.1 ketosynthase [Streptomyces sp. CBMA152]